MIMGSIWANLIINLMRSTKKLVTNSENKHFFIYAIFVKPDPNIEFTNFSRNNQLKKSFVF